MRSRIAGSDRRVELPCGHLHRRAVRWGSSSSTVTSTARPRNRAEIAETVYSIAAWHVNDNFCNFKIWQMTTTAAKTKRRVARFATRTLPPIHGDDEVAVQPMDRKP